MLSAQAGPDNSEALPLPAVFLDLEHLDRNLYRSRHLLPGLPTSSRVYGGLVIGQAMTAAFKTVADDFLVHSIHCYFVRSGDVKMPILYQVDPIRDGKSFVTRGVKAVQDGQAIFTCQVSFHKNEFPVIQHQIKMPNVKPPEECKETSQIIKELIGKSEIDEEIRQKLTRKLKFIPTTFEVKPIDAKVFLRIKAQEPRFLYWMKPKGPIGDDKRLHICLAAYMSDAGMLGAALMPHPHTDFGAYSGLSLDHAMWFHSGQVCLDDWVLYELDSSIADNGRTFINGRLWSRDGVLRVSTAQEAVFRKSKL